MYVYSYIHITRGFSGGSVVKNLPANAGDAGSNPGLGRSLREGNGNPLQDSCMENLRQGSLMDYSPWGRKSQTKLSN